MLQINIINWFLFVCNIRERFAGIHFLAQSSELLKFILFNE